MGGNGFSEAGCVPTPVPVTSHLLGVEPSLDSPYEISAEGDCHGTPPVILNLAEIKGCPQGRLLYRSCNECGAVEGLVVPCNSRFMGECPPCSRRWRRRNRARFMAGIREMRAPKLVTLTLRKPCSVERFVDIWSMRRSFFDSLRYRGHPIRSWCGTAEPPNHLHLVVDCDYIPKGEMKEIWHGVTGDSFILDIRPLQRERDGLAGASAYVTKYLTKASETPRSPERGDGHPRSDAEQFKGFHLIGSWALPLHGSWVPLPHLCSCGGGFGAPFGLTERDEAGLFSLGPMHPPPFTRERGQIGGTS